MSKKKVYLTYMEDRCGGELKDGEPAPFGMHEDIIVKFAPNSLYLTETGWCHTIEVDFDPNEYVNKALFITVVRYTTGCTFGQTLGEWHIEGCYTSAEEAFKVKSSIETDKYEGYKPWDGYFEKLEKVDVCVLLLLQGP